MNPMSLTSSSNAHLSPNQPHFSTDEIDTDDHGSNPNSTLIQIGPKAGDPGYPTPRTPTDQLLPKPPSLTITNHHEPISAHPKLQGAWTADPVDDTNFATALNDNGSARRAMSLFRRHTTNPQPPMTPGDPQPPTPSASFLNQRPSFAGWRQLRNALKVKSSLTNVGGQDTISPGILRTPGAAPGIDVESESIDKYFAERLQASVNGLIVDFNDSEIKIRRNVANQELCQIVQQPRPAFSLVRWVHIEGLSWDVIKIVSQTYGLHPLSVEDALHFPQRVKVDNFFNHLFVAILVCKLPNATATSSTGDKVLSGHRLLKQRFSPVKNASDYSLLDIEADNCSMFLLDDGTFISFTHFASNYLIEPILARLSNSSTMLRSLCDASFLMNSLIDSIVDHYIPITEAYADQFEKLEAIVFERPNIHIIRYLHTTQADLIELKQKLIPVQSLIRNLRTLSHRSASHRAPSISGGSGLMNDSTISNPNLVSRDLVSKQADRMSAVTKTYLGDVQDHIDTCLDHIITLQGWSQNLTELAFNCISYTTNENMKVLTVISVVFLPITFLAGVYGMNFEKNFPEIQWDYAYPSFWIACGVIVSFILVYLKRNGFF